MDTEGETDEAEVGSSIGSDRTICQAAPADGCQSLRAGVGVLVGLGVVLEREEDGVRLPAVRPTPRARANARVEASMTRDVRRGTLVRRFGACARTGGGAVDALTWYTLMLGTAKA